MNEVRFSLAERQDHSFHFFITRCKDHDRWQAVPAMWSGSRSLANAGTGITILIKHPLFEERDSAWD